MGLDIVELVMGFEEEFGVEIPDEAASRMETPRQVLDYLMVRLPTVPSAGCETQRTFYRLRQAFRYVLSDAPEMSARTRLEELSPVKAWPHVWAVARVAAGGWEWPSDVPRRATFRAGLSTLRELTYYVALHAQKSEDRESVPLTRDRIELGIRRVIWEQVELLDFRMGDGFVRDMGLD